MSIFEPYSLSSAIELAAALTRELISALKADTERLAATERPEADVSGGIAQTLYSTRDQALSRLQEMSAVIQPSPAEWQALRQLQKLDTELMQATLDNKIAREPENMELRYHRAVVLSHLGRNQEAQGDFLAVLTRQPDHFGALNDFGNMLFDSGFTSAANTLYRHAVQTHPHQAMGHLNLANLLQAQGEYREAKQHFTLALDLDPALSEAHQGLSYAHAGLGELEEAERSRDLGFNGHPLASWPYRGSGAPIGLLILCSARGGNIPIKHLIDDRVFQANLLFAEYFPADAALPAHQLILNSIGDADLCPEGLARAEILLAKTSAPVLNPPQSVALTGRLANAERLGRLPGVITPKSVILPRGVLLQTHLAFDLLRSHGIAFPLLLRSPGYHTGQYFLCAETAESLPICVSDLPGEMLLVMEMLDARNRQGDFHKYRVMFVDGAPYPLHLALSKHWKVHYFTADMDGQPEAQRLESAFLNDMPSVLGAKAMAGLENICRTLQLDYAGIDFAIDSNDNLLLFEANATMLVPRPEDEEWSRYRREAVGRIRDAVGVMLLERCSTRI